MKRWMFAAALLLPVPQADAAILNGFAALSAFPQDTGGGQNIVKNDPQVPIDPIDTSTGVPTFSAAASVDQDGVLLAASADANVRTGEFAVSASVSETGSSHLANSHASLSVSERVTVTGIGHVLFTLALIGSWDVSLLDFNPLIEPSWLELRGSFRLDGQGGNSFSVLHDNSIGGPGTFSGVINEPLIFTAPVFDGEYDFHLEFSARFFGLALERGSASLSGLLSIEPVQGDATLAFGDSKFLSGPPVVIPLPASALLLLTGLGGLSLLRRRPARG